MLRAIRPRAFSMMAKRTTFPSRYSRGRGARIESACLLIAACALGGMSVVGCSRKTQQTIDSSAMARPVTQLADAAEKPKQFQNLFATGAAPDEKQRLQYVKNMYRVAEIHPNSDVEAELLVKVLDGGGQEIGAVTWTVVQEEGKWKLQSAPLP